MHLKFVTKLDIGVQITGGVHRPFIQFSFIETTRKKGSGVISVGGTIGASVFSKIISMKTENGSAI